VGGYIQPEAPVRVDVRPEQRGQGAAFVVADAVVELGHFEHGLEQQGVDVYQGGCSQGPRHSAGLVFTEVPGETV
jgi:hypothetical protein